MRKNALFLISVLFIPLFYSCSAVRFALVYASSDEKKAGELKDGTYFSERTNYRITQLGKKWERVPLSDGDLAFYNEEAELMITVNSDCEKQRRGVEQTSDSLIAGLGEKQIKLRETIKVGRGSGLYTEYEVYSGRQDLGLATVVYRSSRCDYDFSYFAPTSVFSANLGFFRDFVSGFEELRNR